MVRLTRQGWVKQPIVAELGTPKRLLRHVICGSLAGVKYRMGPDAKVHCDKL
jgi:hypothetical protein